MKEICCLVVSIFLIIVGSTIIVSAVGMPQFQSGLSTKAGIDLDFNTLYSKTSAIYNVMEHDSNHIVWKDTTTTGNWVFLDNNGTIAIASTGRLDLSLKDKFVKDLGDVFSMIKLAGGSVASSDQPVYYAENSREYLVITQPFESNFKLYLNIPNCTMYQARLSVSDTDQAWGLCGGSLSPPGQHYYIDGKEVSGCDLVGCGIGSEGPSGISCGNVKGDEYPNAWVTVNPVDVTKSIPSGLHTITSNGIENRHTLTIEAITSMLAKPIVLYNDGKTAWVEGERKSQSIDGLYALILPTTTANNTTSVTAKA